MHLTFLLLPFCFRKQGSDWMDAQLVGLSRFMILESFLVRFKLKSLSSGQKNSLGYSAVRFDRLLALNMMPLL